MTGCYLGVDVGSSDTRALLCDASGRALGFGRGGPGNHEVVGYAGLIQALRKAVNLALSAAGLSIHDVRGAGFGVSGYDWPSERQPTIDAITALELHAPLELVNDTILGLLAGASQGWGIAVVSGSGCNCWGWDRTHQRVGRVTGHGLWMGEGAGASELLHQAVRALAHQWTRRGPTTALTPLFLENTGCASLEALVEALATGELRLEGGAVQLVFQAAREGDAVALELVDWAGRELGELAACVIRQLEFEALAFEVVLMGGMFKNDVLIQPMRQVILETAPRASLLHLQAPPVVGAVLLGMQAAGVTPGGDVRERLIAWQAAG